MCEIVLRVVLSGQNLVPLLLLVSAQKPTYQVQRVAEEEAGREEDVMSAVSCLPGQRVESEPGVGGEFSGHWAGGGGLRSSLPHMALENIG